ncbi:MAG TPA: hypothetical protein DEW22_07155 [Clostridiales bacterium]|nr:hypothetical protein [Clostridiales bacterium]
MRDKIFPASRLFPDVFLNHNRRESAEMDMSQYGSTKVLPCVGPVFFVLMEKCKSLFCVFIMPG